MESSLMELSRIDSHHDLISSSEDNEGNDVSSDGDGSLFNISDDSDDESDIVGDHLSTYDEATEDLCDVDSQGVQAENDGLGCEDPLCMDGKDIVEDEAMVVHIPNRGMIFENLEELRVMYDKYASSMGFSVNILSTKHDSEGVDKFITFGCHRSKKATSKNTTLDKVRPSCRVDCKARVCTSRQKNGCWKVNKVNMEHKHPLSPTTSRFLVKNRKVTPSMKKILEMNNRAGIGAGKTMRTLAFDVEGFENMSCLEKDCQNYLDKVRKLQLGKGDAESVFNFFSRHKAEDKDFFYEICTDKIGRVKNLVWVHGRSRLVYKEFGDVVCFDTTYLVNKYNMPFAPFVGVNHHGQSILLGCALLSNEKATTFEKVFKIWLKCMDGVAPRGIVTDQCAAIGKAIESVFPQTVHRWCIWHIMSKVPEKLSMYKKYKAIRKYLKYLVHCSTFEEEFELGWVTMLVNYKLEENQWLTNIYERREKWVPVYVNKHFWAGMASTQRSESMNSFFKGYITSKTTLKQFVDQYEIATAGKIEKELLADFQSMNKEMPTFSTFGIEKQFQQVYTQGMYKRVREEFTHLMYCKILKVKVMENKNKHVYEVEYKDKDKYGKTRINCFEVSFEVELKEITCNCLKFESMGLVCSHIFKVLIEKDVDETPSKYILPRWRKDVAREYNLKRQKASKPNISKEADNIRELQLLFSSAADIATVKSNGVEIARDALKGLIKSLRELDDLASCTEACHVDAAIGSIPCHTPNNKIQIRDPPITKSRGRPKTKRLESRVEVIARKKRKTKKKTICEEDEEDIVIGNVNQSNSELPIQETEVHVAGYELVSGSSPIENISNDQVIQFASYQNNVAGRAPNVEARPFVEIGMLELLRGVEMNAGRAVY